jgi:dienelactone hydrolase
MVKIRRWTKSVATLCATLAACGLAPRVDAQGVRIHMHTDEGYAADGALFKPSGEAPFAAVVLVPDERGIAARVVGTAARLEQAGYVVVAVDLNRGMPAAAATRSDEQALHDLGAALAFLAQQPDVRPGDVGVLGFGSGARYALKLAVQSNVRAVAIRDIALAEDVLKLGAPRAAVLASFAGHDPRESHAAIRAFADRQRRLKNPLDYQIYADASAGFDDPEDVVHYRQSDAEDLERRTRDFFSARLGSAP